MRAQDKLSSTWVINGFVSFPYVCFNSYKQIWINSFDDPQPATWWFIWKQRETNGYGLAKH